jgi:hypothetical protein
MSLLDELMGDTPEELEGTRVNWLDRMVMIKPELAEEITQIFDEYHDKGCVRHFKKKAEIYRWLTERCPEFVASYTAFARVMRDYINAKREKENAERKDGGGQSRPDKTPRRTPEAKGRNRVAAKDVNGAR